MKTSNRGKNNKRGIALLFSVMLSAIFLTIALGVLNISVKELNFSTSAKDTNNAFFAADSGVECALYNDKSGSTTFTTTNTSITCFGIPYTLTNSSLSFNFNITGLGSNGKSCVKVNVLKTLDAIGIVTATRITSKGYNTDCSSSATNRVERVLEVNY